MKPRSFAVVVFVVIVALTGVIDAFARDAHLSQVRSAIAAEADSLARDLSDVIARETAGVDTLAAFVEITKDDGQQMASEFPTFASALMDSGETIRSVQLAPDSVIRFVYPIEGNEAALGLDLLADPDRRALLVPAIGDGSTVVQGPVELVQGGLGILVRRPIYNDDGTYWGLAAILLDWPAVAARTDLDNMEGATLAGARLPDMGMVIAGNPAAFNGDPVIRTFRVGATDTEWQIAVRPAQGWPSPAPTSPFIWAAGLVIALAAALGMFELASRPAVLEREREKARRELELAEERYRATFQHAGMGIIISNRAGRVLSANPASRVMMNLPGEVPIEGGRGRDLIHPEDRGEHDAAIARLLGGEPVVQVELRVNGTQDRWCRANITLIDGEGPGRLFVTIVEDVTVRRRTEFALSRSESKFRQLFEQAPIAIQREDHSPVVTSFEKLRRDGISDIRSYLLESPDRLRDILRGVRIIDANPAAEELQGHLERSDGQLTLLDRLSEPTHSTFIETLVAIWEGKSALEQSVESVGPDGSPRFLDVRWHAPMAGDAPDYSNVMVTIADITELRETQRRLETLLESKDRFLASVAHELRTPLTAVVGFAQELKDELGLYSAREKEEFRDLIAFHSTELGNIIEDLLVWARGDIGEVQVRPERIDLGDGVRQSLSSIQGVALDVAEPDGEVEAYADPARLRQIVRNLATNAHRYGGSRVTVQVRRQNGNAIVDVADDGPAMGKVDMQRIFEPYTRSDSVATAPGSIGLGLTVSRSLARLQGGDLVCVREHDCNVFRVSLPVPPDEPITSVGR